MLPATEHDMKKIPDCENSSCSMLKKTEHG